MGVAHTGLGVVNKDSASMTAASNAEEPASFVVDSAVATDNALSSTLAPASSGASDGGGLQPQLEPGGAPGEANANAATYGASTETATAASNAAGRFDTASSDTHETSARNFIPADFEIPAGLSEHDLQAYRNESPQYVRYDAASAVHELGLIVPPNLSTRVLREIIMLAIGPSSTSPQ